MIIILWARDRALQIGNRPDLLVDNRKQVADEKYADDQRKTEDDD